MYYLNIFQNNNIKTIYTKQIHITVSNINHLICVTTIEISFPAFETSCIYFAFYRQLNRKIYPNYHTNQKIENAKIGINIHV